MSHAWTIVDLGHGDVTTRVGGPSHTPGIRYPMPAFDPARIIELCYAAALDPAGWSLALGEIGDAAGARGMVIVSHDPARTARTIHSERLTEVARDYETTWWRHDTRIARCRALGFRPGAIQVDEHYFSPEEKRRDPFFQDFYARHGLDNLAGYLDLDPRDGTMLSVSAPRDARSGAFEGAQIERLRLLAPHAARAFKIGVMLTNERRNAADLASAMDGLRTGVILLDEAGRVRHASAAAQRLAAGTIHLSMRGDLAAVVAAERPKLARLVASALADPVPAGAELSVMLRHRDDGHALFVEAVPLGSAEHGLPGMGAGGAMLLVRDLISPSTRDLTPQLEQFGLTPAEARVAVLVGRGRSPTEAARDLAVSPATTRSQLKAAFAKLGIRRQSELAILVTRLDGT